MQHNKLAAQIVKQANIAAEEGQEFGIVFAAMGVTNDVADYFRRSFEETGVMDRVVMFLNLSNDPIIERIPVSYTHLDVYKETDLCLFSH